MDDLLASVNRPKRDFSDDEMIIIARMMIPMINEVVRCLEEGIITSPAEADMALVYGTGFPPFHGGAFPLAGYTGQRAKYLDMAQRSINTSARCMKCRKGCVIKRAIAEPYYPRLNQQPVPVGSESNPEVTMEQVVIVDAIPPHPDGPFEGRRVSQHVRAERSLRPLNA